MPRRALPATSSPCARLLAGYAILGHSPLTAGQGNDVGDRDDRVQTRVQNLNRLARMLPISSAAGECFRRRREFGGMDRTSGFVRFASAVHVGSVAPVFGA